MALDLITAMPYSIGPYYKPSILSRPNGAEIWLADNAASSRLVATFDGVDMYAVRPKRGVTYFYAKGETQPLMYFMELHSLAVDPEPKSLLRSRASYQASVWRGFELPAASPTFTQQVFWRYLISRTRSVVSDNYQSDPGRDFWMRRIGEGFKRGHRVFVVDCSDSAGALHIRTATEIFSQREALLAYSEDDDFSGIDKRLAIVHR